MLLASDLTPGDIVVYHDEERTVVSALPMPIVNGQGLVAIRFEDDHYTRYIRRDLELVQVFPGDQ